MPPLVLAAAAEAAGYAFANVLLIVATVWVFIGWRRRRARGERATGWLVGVAILGLLVLGALSNAASSGA